MPHLRRPKLGQHFLIDVGYRRRIRAALDLRPDELVVEIGPGRGAMTQLLGERRIVAIELDRSLAEELSERLADRARIEVVRADVLTVDLAALCRRHGTSQCFVFGNLPFYITSPILHHLLSFRQWIRAMALLVQREVAERLVASPGTRDYGYLSVLTQICSRPRIVLAVPPGAFSPPPEVHSALVEFQMGARAGTEPLLPEAEVESFLELVKRCFEHKRKNLANNLASHYPRARIELELSRLSLPPSTRAEQMPLEQFVRLYHRLHSSSSSSSLSSTL